MSSNPYAPPQASLSDAPNAAASPPIWNPNAAANWSLLLSPMFGATLHMLNWRAMGEKRQAAVALGWVIMMSVLSAVALLITLPLRLLVPIPLPTDLVQFTGFVLLVAWYFAAARGQVRYVQQRYGKSYTRRGWFMPILRALIVWIGVFIVLGTITGMVMSGLGVAGPPRAR